MTPLRAILLALVALASVAAAPSLHAQTNLPALPGINLGAPELRAIAADCITARQAVEAARRDQLRQLIQVQIDEAESLLKEKTKVGNVKGIAIGTQAKQIFESALTNLETSGNFEVPGKVRRELDETLTRFAAARAKIETTSSDRLAAIQREHLGRFAAAVTRLYPAQGKTPSEAALAAAFADAVARAAAPPAATNAAASPAAAGAAPAAANAAPAKNLPDILAESGPAGNWMTVGRVAADMMGMDVVDIPVTDRPVGTNRFEKFNPISQQSSAIEYVSLYRLPANTSLVYRLKRIAGREDVDVLDWPQPRNNYVLQVRTRPSEKFPCPHGFEIQVGAPEHVLSAVRSGTPLAPKPANVTSAAVARVFLDVVTAPAGAMLLLDDRAVNELRTPCRFRLPPGVKSVRVRLPGYVDGVFSNDDIRASRTLTWTFQPDPRVVRQTVTVAANATNWVTIADVTEGSRIAIDARGEWSCAAGIPTDAAGYPNNEANYRFYMNPDDYPRQAPAASYGALIWRIAPKGRPAAVGRSLRVVAPESGRLQFDINEGTETRLRADNTGMLVVNVLILPPP